MHLATLYNPQIVEPLTHISGETYINRVVPILINIGLILCVIAFIILLIIGGIKYVTSGGDRAKLEGARNAISNAIIGIIILLLLWLIAQILNLIFGVNIGGFGPPGYHPPAPTPTSGSSVPGICADTSGNCGCVCPPGYEQDGGICTVVFGPCMGTCTCRPFTNPTPTGFCTSDCVSWTDVIVDNCTPLENWNEPRNGVCMTPYNIVHVQLRDIPGATQVQIQNFDNTSLWCHDSSVDWSGVPVTSYNGATTIYPWNVTAGTGEKKVCSRFINPSGEASCCGGMIEVESVGGPCNSGSDCTSGLCGQDMDGDTFPGSGPGICLATGTPMDCNDNNNLVYPGQTQYFETPISGSNYDYDCNGVNEKWPQIDCISAGPPMPACSLTPLSEGVIRPLTGWNPIYSIPDCGVNLTNPYKNFYMCTSYNNSSCAMNPGVVNEFGCFTSCLTGNQCGWGEDELCTSWNMDTWRPLAQYLGGVTRMPCK